MALFVQADAGRLPLPDQSVDLVVGSPPYCEARLYLEDGNDLGIARDAAEWVEWMLEVTAECLRVSRGLVIWVAAGVTRDRTYQPAVEGLMWEWFKRGGSSYRPCYWNRVGIPGSGGDQWYRADVEIAPIFAIKRPGPLPYADPLANGEPPKWAPGGAMSHRLSDGARVNQWGGRPTSGRNRRRNGDTESPGRPSHRIHTKRDAAGDMAQQSYTPPVLANPGNLIRTTTGGNQLGHPAAHENEAPFPVAVPAWFIKSHSPPGGIVLDPFSGSGTTAEAAEALGRSAIGTDLRRSQALLASRRLARPHAPVIRRKGGEESLPLFGPEA